VTIKLPSEFESLRNAATRTDYSVDTFRELINAGKLRAYRISDKPGSAIRVKRSDVDALMKPLLPEAIYADRAGRRA
jgi:excisionase family DNA binding protein